MQKEGFSIAGRIVDVVGQRIFSGRIHVEGGKIVSVEEGSFGGEHYLMPGLVDAHIHIESSMLIPSEFARLAVVHGTVGTVSDPHEIANVLGIPGVQFMIENGRKVPFKFNFGAPSCVPATSFETSGATLGIAEVEELLQMPEIRYLSEMMNFPGVLFNDPQVMGKLALARKAGKPIDGHAPGVKGEDARKYISAGISTDHECFTLEEATEKIQFGMKVLIREGSAAKNFEALCTLIEDNPGMVMMCSDDKHPNDLVKGHINLEVKRALQKGFDFMKVIRSCTYNPVTHYGLEIGLLQPGDPADFIVVNNLDDFQVEQTYIDGVLVAQAGKTLIGSVAEVPCNNFNIGPLPIVEIEVTPAGSHMAVIKALDGQLITENLLVAPRIQAGKVVGDPGSDILKIVVKNRYFEAPAAIGFIAGFGLKSGALASCVAHDSHNIVAVGVDDASIQRAINGVIESKGGVAFAEGEELHLLPLPFAGIMSGEDGYEVAARYDQLDRLTKAHGATLTAPFMTLSFMALLVIPSLKLSDKGLFDGTKFAFTPLFTN